MVIWSSYDFVKGTSFKVAGTVKITSVQYQCENKVLEGYLAVIPRSMGLERTSPRLCTHNFRLHTVTTRSL
jgi:hypothetical protein